VLLSRITTTMRLRSAVCRLLIYDAIRRTPYEEVKKNAMVVTRTPPQVIESRRVFERYGVDRLMCHFRVGLMPAAMAMDTMRMFGKVVLPAFK